MVDNGCIYILSVKPDRPNIKNLCGLHPSTLRTTLKKFSSQWLNTQDNLEEILQPMADDLLRDTTDYPLTIVYNDTGVISFACAFF